MSSYEICGKVIQFPQDAEMAREARIARATDLLDTALFSLLNVTGVTGATRITVLMLEEMLVAHSEDIVANSNLSRKIARMSKIFAE